MNIQPRRYLFTLFVAFIALAAAGATECLGQPQPSPPVSFITAEESKAKVESGAPVTIIDVRSVSDSSDSERKIKGAIHIKLRRLRSRLAMPPLSAVSRTSDVVLYCACPNDEASIRGAQIMSESGFKRVQALKGGWQAWKKSNGQIESRPKG